MFVEKLSKEKRDYLLKELKELNPDALVMDDLFEALIGIGRQNGKYYPIYSRDIILEILRNKFVRDGISTVEESYIDALEYYNFNISSAYMDNAPIFMEL